ncbi:hypothetical protein [Kitasatospora sp. NPDC051914]|uniref:hypothetical protein n=1 Tax=Kitasatospora sp. NPDC051914 TaxID=3154945 RepID=UPI00343F47C2
MRLPMFASAILPLVIIPESGEWLSITVNVAAWSVFLADYVMHVRHLERYASSPLGRFDPFVVIATAPGFLLPGADAGRFVLLLRGARLARLLLVTRGRGVCSHGWDGLPWSQPAWCCSPRRSPTTPNVRSTRSSHPSVTPCGGAR